MRNSGFKVIALVAALLGSLASPAQVAAQRAVALLRFDSTWKYLANGSDQGTAWRAKTFDDSAWLPGQGLLGVEQGTVYPYAFNTMFPSFDPLIITYYFRAHFTLQASDFVPFMTLMATNFSDDGSVVYLNGTEVARFRVPAGQNYMTVSPGPGAEGQYEIPPLLPGGGNMATNALVVGDNVIAVEVHQVNNASSDIVHGMSLFANIPTFSAIAFTSQPQSQTAVVGTSFTLSATISGGPATFQWQRTNAAGVYVNISGATSSNFVNNSLTVPTILSYRLIASNVLNTVTSSVAVVTVVADTFGPLIVSATVIDSAPSNRIELVFSEPLLSGSVNAALTNDTFRVVMFGTNITVGISNSTYLPAGGVLNTGPLEKVLLVLNTTNWFYRSNYYIILNNIRDIRNNVIAPNSIIPVTWLITSNIFTPDSQYWVVQDAWGPYVNPEYDQNNPGIYTNAWTATNYYADPFLGWSNPKNGFLYYDASGTLNASCFMTAATNEAGGQDNPSLFRGWFMWPSNAPANVDLKFSYSTDDGAAIFLNGTFLFSDTNFPAGTIDNRTRATVETDGRCRTNTVPAALRPGSNLLAVAVAQYNPNGTSPFDSIWALRLDAITGLTSPLPQTSVVNRLTISRPTSNTTRIIWPTNAFGWALEYSTNIIRVGNSNVSEGPWLQEQPNMANTLARRFTITNMPPGARRFYRLRPTQ